MTGEEWIESDACPSYNVNFIVTEEPGTVPVEEAKINMSGTIRYTDESGEALFEGYEEGDYNYSVIKDGFTMQSGDFDIVDEDVTIEVILLINFVDEALKEKVNIYPNPNNGLFILKTDVFPAYIEIYNATGEIMLQQQINQNETELNIQDYPKGIYFIKYECDGDILTGKLIKIQ